MDENQKLDTWGVVEVMGHKRFAGHISEQTIGGTAFVRVDVPATITPVGPDVPAFCKLIGAGSIYCITPTDEATARKAAAALSGYTDVLPVYIPPEPKQLAAVPSQRELDEEGEDWREE